MVGKDRGEEEMMISIAIVFATVLAAPPPAPAPAAPTPAPVSDQDADAAAVAGELDGMRHLIFGEDDVEGAVNRPLEQVVPHRRPGKGGSLIKVRAHFLPELIRRSIDL